jgi:hypothetical protein
MIFGTWVTIVASTMFVAESLNCLYPRIEDTYDSEGLVCQWEVSDFDYDVETGYTLKEIDSTDNCIEAKVRKFKN